MTWPEVSWVGLSQFMYHHMLHEEAGTCEEGIFNEKLQSMLFASSMLKSSTRTLGL